MDNSLWLRYHRQERERVLQELASRPRLDRAPSARERLLARIARRTAIPAAIRRNVTIRHAAPADAERLAELAAMSERRLPSGPILVAECGNGLVAAVPVDGGAVLADIRQPTADVVQLLELRSTQLRHALRAA
ncbi:MAG: hypothetical protein U0R50_13175 [Gaiellales bacterium]